MANAKIGLQLVQSFIRNDLPKKLAKDLAGLRIIKEADLEVAAYYHLRRHLRTDRAWRVLARKHVPQTGYFVDLLIFRNKYPRIAVELKWNRARISRKDRRSLTRAVDTLGVNKAYFMATCVKKAPYQKIKKTEVEKNRIFEVIVTPRLSKDKFAEWKRIRKGFMSEMANGKALKGDA
jgi:hypothetical protein